MTVLPPPGLPRAEDGRAGGPARADPGRRASRPLLPSSRSRLTCSLLPLRRLPGHRVRRRPERPRHPRLARRLRPRGAHDRLRPSPLPRLSSISPGPPADPHKPSSWIPCARRSSYPLGSSSTAIRSSGGRPPSRPRRTPERPAPAPAWPGPNSAAAAKTEPSEGCVRRPPPLPSPAGERARFTIVTNFATMSMPPLRSRRSGVGGAGHGITGAWGWQA